MRAQLYLHFIFSHEIYHHELEKYFRLCYELNSAYKAHLASKALPCSIEEMPDVSSEHIELLRQGMVKLNVNTAEYDFIPSKVRRAARFTATSVLASNTIEDAAQAEAAYAARSGIELCYRWEKTVLKGKALDVSTDKALDGKAFILSLCTELYSKLNTCLRHHVCEDGSKFKLRDNSLCSVLHQLDGIEYYIAPNGRRIVLLNGGVTQQSDEIFKAAGVPSLKKLSRSAGVKAAEGLVTEGGQIVIDTADDYDVDD